jgi:hypothetical protein
MNQQITAYIENAPSEHKTIMQTIRSLIHESVPEVTEEYKWSRPVFRVKKDFAYLKTSKNYVTLGFNNYQKIHDPGGKLEGTGKDLRHIKLRSLKDIDPDELKKWLVTVASE